MEENKTPLFVTQVPITIEAFKQMYQEARDWRRFTLYIMVWLLAIFSAFTLIEGNPELGIILLLLLILLPIMFVINQRKGIKRMVNRMVVTEKATPRYSFYEDGFQIRDEAILPFDRIEKMKETKNYIFLYLPEKLFIPVRKDSFETGTLYDFKVYIQEKTKLSI